MSAFASAIDTGVFLFPFAAILAVLPYVVYSYRRFGVVNVWKALLFFSFVFYFICCWCLVVLPLPADPLAVVPHRPQLRPFVFLADIAAHSGLSLRDASTWLPALRSPSVYNVLFNVLLTVPLGFYLRYYFRRTWWQALALGFATSLAFELTQLTGDWGLYPVAYRTFDVDDLITNTLGCIVGFVCAIPVARVLPDLTQWEEETLAGGDRLATFPRRALAMVADMSLVFALVVLRVVAVRLPNEDLLTLSLTFVAATAAVFMLVPTLTRGRTPGHALLRLRVVRPDGSRPAWWRYVVRYGLLLWGFLMLPLWMLFLMPASFGVLGVGVMLAVVLSVYAVWGMSLVGRGLYSLLAHRPFHTLTGLLSGTRTVTEAQARDAARRRARRLRQG